jgi:hypothetical protein
MTKNSRSGELCRLAILSLSGASQRGRQVTGGPGAVRMCCEAARAGFRRAERGQGTLRDYCPLVMILTLGIRAEVVCAGTDKDVMRSSRRSTLTAY